MFDAHPLLWSKWLTFQHSKNLWCGQCWGGDEWPWLGFCLSMRLVFGKQILGSIWEYSAFRNFFGLKIIPKMLSMYISASWLYCVWGCWRWRFV